jgi:glycosyltransferase involved in cell wall biosynthesis
MKILICNWRCWLNPDMGGAEVFTHEVAKRWVKRGHEVTLFTSEFFGCKREEVLDGIRVVRRGSRLGVYWWARRAYRKRFTKEGFDAVIDEINTRPFFMPNVVKNDAKTVALIHQLAREYWFYETPFPVSYLGYHFLEDRWLRQYVDVPTVTVSDSTRKDLEALGFKRVYVVPEGLNFEPLREVPKKSRAPVVIYAGRLKRAKRPDHALRAFRIVKEKLPDSELWVVGDGPFKTDLERMACDGVKFFGHTPDGERRELVKQAWVLVNPSVREGWGLNVVEANALGTTCIAYDVPGLKDSVKDLVTGLLAAEAGNVGNLAEKIITVLNDGSLRSELSQNAMNYSREFSWDRSAKEFLRILESVIDGR